MNNYTLEIRQGKSSIIMVRTLGEITDFIKYNHPLFANIETEFIITKGEPKEWETGTNQKQDM